MILTWIIEESGDLTTAADSRLENLTSLDTATLHLPQGAYTTFRTYQVRGILRFGEHIIRMRETAALLGKPMDIPEERIRNGLRSLFRLKIETGEMRIRLTLDLFQHPGTIYITAEPLELLPEKLYQYGAHAITSPLHRENPKAKSTSFIEKASDVKKTLLSNVNEAIMVDAEGYLLEGLSSNFFAVMNGELWTANDKVLSGITRHIVLDEAEKTGLQCHLRPVQIQDLSRCSETFITSTSRAVLPVTKIDKIFIGHKRPGPITKLLLARYQQRILAELDWF